MFLVEQLKSISIGMHCAVTAMRRQREPEQVTDTWTYTTVK